MDTQMLVVAVVVVVLIAIAFWMYSRRRQSEHLEKRFGPEYGRAVHEFGSRDKAEAELLARQKRVAELDIVPLTPADAQRFTQQWRTLQARFVDNPQGVLVEADRLVRELMQARGYPMGDFERRAADISVHHPNVVDHYRAAHDIAEQERQGQVDTEGMRQAVIHYRALFSELLQVEEPRRDEPAGHHHHQDMRTQP
jgi:hypothetical protein